MPEIRILPKEVYQLIAAGEVVERPSSVVKEMIENSIDAGAKNITIEIKNGGSTYIRITDDGCGISADQVRKVFISHATSKISDAVDLDAIGTLGFRGEAMASISAVSRVELLTRAVGENMGTRYVIAGGEEIDCSEAGCPEGTTIVVRDLFFNTPARMKFLKKDVTEGNAVSGVVDRMAISHPDISFRFIRESKQQLVTSGRGDLRDTVYSVLGREFADSLVDVDYSINGMRVSGVVTKPHSSRKSRSMQFFFINSRIVKSKTALAALEQAYRNSIMVGRFPGCVLNIECDNSFVDVNVHPAKIEVRFVNEKPVFELVYYGVKSAIEIGDTVKEADFGNKNNSFASEQQLIASGKIDFFKKQDPRYQQMSLDTAPQQENPWHLEAPLVYNSHPERRENDTVPTEDRMSPDEFRSQFVSPDDVADDPPETDNTVVADTAPVAQPVPDHRVIGEAFMTYIFVEIGNDLYIIDKHAAHERMNFERLRAQTVITSQVLLSPVTVRLSAEEYTAVCDNFDVYEKCGFVLEDFGNNTVIVRECPSLLNGENVSDLIYETASKLLDGKTDITPEKMDWIFHSTACRSAVKAGDYTTPEERELFVSNLLSMPDIRYCPHGRPVMIKVTKYEIEKQFGRIQ